MIFGLTIYYYVRNEWRSIFNTPISNVSKHIVVDDWIIFWIIFVVSNVTMVLLRNKWMSKYHMDQYKLYYKVDVIILYFYFENCIYKII